MDTVTPGDIVALYHLLPDSSQVARPVIVWDTHVDGEEAVWLVTWASTDCDTALTAGDREPGKPLGEPFQIRLGARTGGARTWESISRHVVAGGLLPEPSYAVVGRYLAHHEPSNGVPVMAEQYRQREAMLSGPTNAITALGPRRAAMVRHLDAVTHVIREELPGALAEGRSKAWAAEVVEVTRPTIYGWLGESGE